MGWGSEETHMFVKLYLNHKCLWNIEDEDYKHKHMRLEAYRDISKKFYALYHIQLIEPEVKSKIKSLRSTYNQYLQKMRRDRRSIESLCTSLIWFKDMHKCFSSIKIPRRLYEESVKHDDSLEPETDLEDSSQKVWVPDEPSEEYISDNIKNPLISPTDDDYILLLKNEPVDAEELTSPYKKKRKYKWHTRNSLANSSTNQSKDMNAKETISKEDEFDIYGKYIASQLREMGLQRALRVQLQIQNIVSEARLDSLCD